MMKKERVKIMTVSLLTVLTKMMTVSLLTVLTMSC